MRKVVTAVVLATLLGSAAPALAGPVFPRLSYTVERTVIGTPFLDEYVLGEFAEADKPFGPDGLMSIHLFWGWRPSTGYTGGAVGPTMVGVRISDPSGESTRVEVPIWLSSSESDVVTPFLRPFDPIPVVLDGREYELGADPWLSGLQLQATATPEPSTMALAAVGFGLTTLRLVRRWRS